jgi:lichenan operon transcriptional antiterminator
MKKKQIELIRYLSNQKKPTSSTEIANALAISVRSVKNYVHEINGLYGKNIILSSRNGYELNEKSNYSILLAKDESYIPQSAEERSYFIIKQLILNHSAHIDIFDLCDSLCVSYSTIKSIISKMNKTFGAYNIEFICENEAVRIKGNEIDKRKLLRYVINEESKDSFMNANMLKGNFGSVEIDKLNNIITSTFQNHCYYLNDFSQINLLLHLSIIIDREKNGYFLNSGQEDIVFDNKFEEDLFQDLIDQLQKNFQIRLNTFELFEVYTLIKANANFSFLSPNFDLTQIVGDDIVTLTKKYVEDINALYMIDLNSEAFITPFSLHLKNLLYRISEGHSTLNPMVETLKSNNPIVFDISIYISLDLMDRFNISISEDETAFLAMHIGAEIERQASNRNKIPALLICPNYQNLAQQALNTLMINFGNQLHIVKCLHSEDKIEQINQNYDIIFTMIPLEKTYSNCDVVRLSILNLSSQLGIIQNALMKSQEQFQDYKLKLNFHKFFEEDLFILNDNLQTKQQVLANLCDALLVKNYTDIDFEEEVNKREDAASTAFGNIAIPHSAKMNAIKTSVAVAISKKGFQWNSNTVHVVFLLAINKADRITFRHLYESLISIFTEPTAVAEVRNCNSFEQFESFIYSRIGNKDYND